jgi:ferredoxin
MIGCPWVFERKIKERSVYIVTEDCVGCESCVELCPDVFEFDVDAEKARVIMSEGGHEERIEESMDSCPSECIHWEEE